jgi:hypothetical protein
MEGRGSRRILVFLPWRTTVLPKAIGREPNYITNE